MYNNNHNDYPDIGLQNSEEQGISQQRVESCDFTPTTLTTDKTESASEESKNVIAVQLDNIYMHWLAGEELPKDFPDDLRKLMSDHRNIAMANDAPDFQSQKDNERLGEFQDTSIINSYIGSKNGSALEEKAFYKPEFRSKYSADKIKNDNQGKYTMIKLKEVNMKKFIRIPRDGNCLFNAVLLGYVDANNGQYPVVNGTEIITQEQLRNVVQSYYQNILDSDDNVLRQKLIQTIRNELITVILHRSFQGFNSNSCLLNRLQNIAEIINLETDEDMRAITLLEEINDDLIQNYVHSLSTIWGGETEINALRIILGANIRISGHGNQINNEIELMYVGGNHYDVYINHSDNVEVSQFIEQIGGSQNSQERLSFAKRQMSKIENLDDRQFHLLLQIIFNTREAEHADQNKTISSEEINKAIEVLYKLNSIKTQVSNESQNPHFVLNCPMYVPDDNSDDGYESDYSNISVPENFDSNKKDKYFIAKKALETVEAVDSTYNPDRNSKHVSVLINKLRAQGFEKEDAKKYKSNIGIVIGLNKPKSLSSKKNNYLNKELSSFQNSDREKVLGFRWQYKWMERYTKKGKECTREVGYKEVFEFYKKLKKHDSDLAKQFRENNERDVEVPYSLIRETIKNHQYTKDVVKFFQMKNHYIIYLSIIDSDTMNFNGVYSAYLRIIATQSQQPTIMSTGYIFSDDLEQNAVMTGIINILSFGSQVDRLVRIITAREFPLGVYYPEPNFCILIPVGAETIIESFLDKTEKREAVALVKQTRSRDKFNAVFIDDKPIITRIPDRAYYDRQTAEQFQFSSMFLQGSYSSGTQQDFENLARMAQSHFGGNNWALSFIGVDKPDDAKKATARKDGLEKLLNTYREYQFQERIDSLENSDIRTQLIESGLSCGQINRIESIIEIVTNAAYIFVTAPDINVDEFLEFLHVLFDFSYKTKIPKNQIRDFYIQYKDLFDMDLLNKDNIARIVRYCGLEVLEDNKINDETLDRLDSFIDEIERKGIGVYSEESSDRSSVNSEEIERNGIGVYSEEGSDPDSVSSEELEKRKDLINLAIEDEEISALDGFIDHYRRLMYKKQNREPDDIDYDDEVEIAKQFCYEDGCPEGWSRNGSDYESEYSEDNNQSYDYCITNILYNSTNPILRQDELLHQAGQVAGIDGINRLINLGEQDDDVARGIITATRDYGISQVLNILMSDIKTNNPLTNAMVVNTDVANTNINIHSSSIDITIPQNTSWVDRCGTEDRTRSYGMGL